MKGMKIWTSSHTGPEPPPLPGPRLSASDLAEGVRWPYPPRWIVRFQPEDSPYVVDIEVDTDDEGEPSVTGIAVRAGLSTTPDGTPEDPWLEGGWFDAVVPRDVQRMPLATYARAALAKVRDPFTEEGRQELRRILVPPGRPRRGRGGGFYREILQTARQLEEQGIRPVRQIARRKRVTENVVHQWLHRARKLEADESSPAPRAGKRTQGRRR